MRCRANTPICLVRAPLARPATTTTDIICNFRMSFGTNELRFRKVTVSWLVESDKSGMTFLRIVIPLYLFCLSMISAQTLRVVREGKPVPTFPDHALARASITKAHASQSRQFDGRPPQIDAEHRAEQVDLDAFDPADRQAEVSAEGDADTRSRRRQSEHVTIIRKVLADRGRRQRGAQFRNCRQYGCDKRIGIRSRPGAIVAVRPQFVAFDRGMDFGNHAFGSFAVGGGDRFRH